MLNGLGVSHGVDLDALLAASDFICGALGREPQSRVARALRSRRLEAEQ
jgi:hydroxymethylglutaryl-CoA lyase